jgi:hypothetical protein
MKSTHHKKSLWWARKKKKQSVFNSEISPLPKVFVEDLSLTSSNRAIIYKSEMDFISRCILDYPNIETGGELFGFWSVSGTPVVLYAIGPGPSANHQSTFFNQDTEYLNKVGSVIVDHFGLHHIGEWHSHHQLGLAQPSGHDAQTMFTTIRNHNLHRFLCCIGNCTNEYSTLNAFNFVDNRQYSRAEWSINDLESPFRKVIDEQLGVLLQMPRTRKASYKAIARPTTVTSQSVPSYPDGYWLNEKTNRLVLKDILDYITSRNSSLSTSVNMDPSRYVHILSQGDSFIEDIMFGEGFPNTAPDIKRIQNGIIQSLRCPEWSLTNDIFSSFANYYSSIHTI